MVNYECAFSQSESGENFEWIINVFVSCLILFNHRGAENLEGCPNDWSFLQTCTKIKKKTLQQVVPEKRSWFILSNLYCPLGDKPLEKQAFGLKSINNVYYYK